MKNRKSILLIYLWVSVLLTSCAPEKISGKVYMFTEENHGAEFHITISSRKKPVSTENGINVTAKDLITVESSCAFKRTPVLMSMYAGTQNPTILGEPALLNNNNTVSFRLIDFLQNPVYKNDGIICSRFTLIFDSCSDNPESNRSGVAFILPKAMEVKC